LCGDDTGDCRSHNAAAFTGAITGDKNAFLCLFPDSGQSENVCQKTLFPARYSNV